MVGKNICQYMIHFADGTKDTTCSERDARDIGSMSGQEYRIFQRQRGKWHMIFDSEAGY